MELGSAQEWVRSVVYQLVDVVVAPREPGEPNERGDPPGRPRQIEERENGQDYNVQKLQIILLAFRMAFYGRSVL